MSEFWNLIDDARLLTFPACPTTAANAAAQGLSIVVPVYNEAAGLAALHERLIGLATTLKARYGLACEVVYVDDGSADDTLAIARTLAGRCARRPGGVAVAQFRQGSRADGRARPCPPRRGAVHGRRRPASADLVEKLVAHWIDDGYDVVYTAKAHRDNESFLRRLAVHGFYALINWGARQKIPEDAGDFRLLSPRAAAALRQLPERNRFFKGLADLDRLPPDPRRLRAGAARAWRHHLQPGPADRPVDRGPDLVLGGAAALRQPARRAARDRSPSCSASRSSGRPGPPASQVPGYPSLVVGLMTIGGVQLIMIGIVGEYIGKILSELKARPIYFVAEHSEKRADGETSAPSAAERTAAE